MNSKLPSKQDAQESRKVPVVVTHGLDGRKWLMKLMQSRFQRRGFESFNFHYAARKFCTPEHASELEAFFKAKLSQYEQVDFVTHSMGGIVLRRFLSQSPYRHKVRRLVMLGPPNQGSHMARLIKPLPPARWFFGPALNELAELELDLELPANIEIGIIAGTGVGALGWIPVFKENNDGVVSVSETKLQAASEWTSTPCAHGYLPMSVRAFQLAEQFLRQGSFSNPSKALS